ncbi:head GIN domain-containing protein [Mucilaginibacter sp. CSA2-8R]|uniref:head GIN domain-containing protein n=1 Tax=Mucilaginibacter sp. CSA2-8R TaxID=3141542 RepID=UPI00315D1948
MKKHLYFLPILLLLIGVITLPACHIGCIKGSGKKVNESRMVGSFSKLDISGEFKINLKQDSGHAVTVMADDNLMKYIKTEVSGDKLRVFTRKNFCSENVITVTIPVKQLSEIKGSGAVTLTSDGRINTQNFKMELSGVSKVDMDLSAADVQTKVSGAAEISLKGQAASHKVEVAGISKLHAFDFVVGNYNIQTSGSGNCEINVLKTLIVHTSGAADIKYKGNPSSIESEKSGASKLVKVQ